MNIDTSSSAVASTSSTSSTSNVQSSSKSSKTESSSFDEEMKSASAKEEQSAEKTEEISAEDETTSKTEDSEKNDVKTNQDSDSDKNSSDNSPDDMLKAELSYSDIKLGKDSQAILSKNIQSLLNTSDRISFANADYSTLKASIDYQTITMDDNDALFFTDLVKNTDMSMQSIASQFQQMSEVNVQAAEKTAKVSAIMMNMLSESLKTNQPFRIDFDKDISVILKVNKDGSIMANFIPGDKAVEEYLKNNIGFLRQRFDDQNLSYSQLSYSKHKQQQEQQSKNKKENADE